MEKATEAREKNEQGAELEQIKLAVVNSVASGLDGLVDTTSLKNELNGIVEEQGRLAIDDSNTSWEVIGKESKIKYEISKNGNVIVKSGITLSTTKIEFLGDVTTYTLEATLSNDLKGTINWSIPENNGVASISATEGNSIIVSKIGDSGSTTITATLNGTSYPVTCEVKIKAPTVADLIPGENDAVTALNADANTTIQDIYGNNVIIPAGFGIAKESGKSVQEGIVIEDASSTGENSAKRGSQFVWVPVGTFNKNDNELETVNITRYDYSGNSIMAVSGGAVVYEKLLGNGFEFSETDGANGNTVARKDANNKIEAVEKAKEKGGFYIGRYETGIGNVSKANQTVYSDITRDNAKIQARQMYDNKEFLYRSDLLNSYVWDTTIDFIQKCGTKENSANYAYQIGFSKVSTSEKQATGTNLLAKDINGNDLKIGVIDEQCNIFDMAGNVKEWTTEYTVNPWTVSLVQRGGGYGNNDRYAAYRRPTRK